jgi:ubiquinone/menaquinone biosynthesis C-methylase UbiE
MSNKQVIEYFAQSAAVIEAVYEAPERQEELAELRTRIQELLRGHVVLELGCGAGFWTLALAQVCDTVLATDANPGLIALARERELPADKVSWNVVDALDLPLDLGEFTAVFVGFLWSHLLRDEQDHLLAQLRKRVGKDVLLVLVDDEQQEDESVARTDMQGNTYQILTTPGGERFELPKNYPSDSALKKRLAPALREIRIERSEHYWMATGRLK